jgi:hypothetical protein
MASGLSSIMCQGRDCWGSALHSCVGWVSLRSTHPTDSATWIADSTRLNVRVLLQSFYSMRTHSGDQTDYRVSLRSTHPTHWLRSAD